jgi:hypothetical protein
LASNQKLSGHKRAALPIQSHFSACPPLRNRKVGRGSVRRDPLNHSAVGVRLGVFGPTRAPLDWFFFDEPSASDWVCFFTGRARQIGCYKRRARQIGCFLFDVGASDWVILFDEPSASDWVFFFTPNSGEFWDNFERVMGQAAGCARPEARRDGEFCPRWICPGKARDSGQAGGAVPQMRVSDWVSATARTRGQIGSFGQTT